MWFFDWWYQITDWAEKEIHNDPVLSFFLLWSEGIYDMVFLWGMIIIILWIIYDLLTKKKPGTLIAETISNVFTLVPFYFSEIVVGAAAVAIYFIVYWNMPFHLPVDVMMFFITLFLADFIYYVEHYFSHKIRILWAAHSVHHSSPIMNISVAFRFSFLDPLVGFLFHLPLIFLGFHPAFVFGAEILVQAYQAWIHTEKIWKLGPLEYIFNTPSAHRVHHGSNRKYLDKNYGGILIIYDRFFGTYQEEEEKVVYGLTKPINSVNPIKVQMHEIVEICKDFYNMPGFINKIKLLYKGPGWKPKTK